MIAAGRLFLRGIIGTSGGLILYAIANYATLAIAARVLGDQDFGLFAAYYTIVSLLLVPASTLRFLIVRVRSHGGHLPIGTALVTVVLLSVAACALAVRTVGIIAQDPAVWFNNACVVIATLFAATTWLGRGDLLGKSAYRRYTVSLTGESVSRLALLAYFLGHPASPAALLAVLVISRLLGHLGLQWPVENGKATDSSLTWLRAEYTPVTLSNLLAISLYNFDLLIVGARFPELAGGYAAITLVGKFIIFAGSVVGDAFVGVRARAGRYAILLLGGLSAVLWIPLIAFVIIAPARFVALVAGGAHSSLDQYLGDYAWFSVANGLIYVLFLEGAMNGRRGRMTVAMAVVVGVEVLVLGTIAASPSAVLASLPIIGVIGVLAIAASLLPDACWSAVRDDPRRLLGRLGFGWRRSVTD